MGHGFWQFSPELMYRVFSPENGFEMMALLLKEEGSRGGRYMLTRDPKILRTRVTLVNARPTFIVTIARRTAATPIFEPPPQQSDYAKRWIDRDEASAADRTLRKRVRMAARWVRKALRPRFRPKLYTPVSPAELMAAQLPGLR